MSQQPPPGHPSGSPQQPQGPWPTGGRPASGQPPWAAAPPPGNAQGGQWAAGSAGPQGYPYGPPPASPPAQPGPWNVDSPWYRPQAPQPQPGPAGPANAWPANDPAAPLGRQAPSANSIANYQPPRRRWPWWLAGGAAAAVVVVLAVNVAVPGGLLPVPTSPTPTIATATTSPMAGGTAFESSTEDATGYWRVARTEWGAGYADVLIEITCRSGSMTYSFFAFENSASQGVDSEISDRAPSILTGALDEGESVQGWVRFPLAQETSTIVLATRSGRQISALEIKP